MLTDGSGLVSHAVTVDRPDMLALLLDLGLDPDESGRVEGLEEVVPTWGEPLRACAISGQVAMAEILLAHGANPNTNVYAASSAMYEAYKRRDQPMVALLERHGGRLTAVAVADLGLVEQAARLLAEDADGRTAEGITGPESSVAQDLLWGAIESPSPEIVSTGAPRRRLAAGRSDDGTASWRMDCTSARRATVAVTVKRFALCWSGAIRTSEADEGRRSSMKLPPRVAD